MQKILDFFLKLRISTKITMIVLLVVFVSVTVVSMIAFLLIRTSIKDRYLDQIQVIADQKSQKIQTSLSEIESAILVGQRLNAVREQLDTPVERINAGQKIQKDTTTKEPLDTNDIDTIEGLDPVIDVQLSPQELKAREDSIKQAQQQEILFGPDLDNAFSAINTIYKLNNIYLTDKDGYVAYISDVNKTTQQKGTLFKEPSTEGNMLPEIRKELRDSIKVSYSKVFLQNGTYLLLAAVPIKATDEKSIIGVLVYEINIARIDRIASDKTGLGVTGEVILAQIQDENKIKYINTGRNKRKDGSKILPLQEAGLITDKKVMYPLSQAIKKTRGTSENEDYRGENTLAAYRFIAGVDWAIVVKIDTEEIYQPTAVLLRQFIITGIITIIATFIIGLIFSQFLIRPLGVLRKTVSSLGRGELPSRIESASGDEIGEMTEQINGLVENLRNTSDFAKRIGNKDFATDFKPASDSDVLGSSLLSMRDSIMNSSQKDDADSWIVKGVAEVGDILRESNDLKHLSEAILAYVVPLTGAIQGAFYVADRETETLEMIASYAYNKKKYLNAKFKFAEGLVGQAAMEKDLIVRTEIPDNYMTLTSGLLGDKKPKCLLITPLITNDTEVYGVLEIAGFEKFGEREMDFVVRISDIIARTVFNIKVTENTERLLQESELLNTNLGAQQAVLNLNAKEMARTQDQLKKSNADLEIQFQEVENEQRRTQALLENASEVITIYEADETIRYISPSVEKILGYTQEEMIGIKDEEYVVSGKKSFRKMFLDLVAYPDEKITIEFSYKKKSGESIFLEASGRNLLSDPIIGGLVVNSRDITERKVAEREQKERGKMQALSENSLDLITRLDRNGKVLYMNPVIENYTTKKKELYIQQQLTNELISPQIISSWMSLIDSTIARNQKAKSEITFPSVDGALVEGDRIMQVNAIPEAGEDGSVESFLVVSHDITEMRKASDELEASKKKVTDSINYAKRIQDAIMPDTGLLRSFFTDSFIMFKPKDVVSGDFPWMIQRDNTLYIACVDCTGHGVPGALMSLVGYFLLNNILDTQLDPNPGVILDYLDEYVTKTLRQDTGEGSAKDGMDVGFCKINLDTNELEFAGAHRPLYFVNGETNELEEYKGDKFPIGGGQYRNRTKFTNTVIKFNKNDTMYMFSDGLPDQFGGDDNRKFSPKRIRDIVKMDASVPMEKIEENLDRELTHWMKDGQIKQTDDILMIAIRF